MRLFFACSLVSAWLVLLLVGVALGGATHLLLVAAVVVYPWGGQGAGSTR